MFSVSFSRFGCNAGTCHQVALAAGPEGSIAAFPAERSSNPWDNRAQACCPTCCSWTNTTFANMQNETGVFPHILLTSCLLPLFGNRNNLQQGKYRQFPPVYAPKDHVKCWRKVSNTLSHLAALKALIYKIGRLSFTDIYILCLTVIFSRSKGTSPAFSPSWQCC